MLTQLKCLEIRLNKTCNSALHTIANPADITNTAPYHALAKAGTGDLHFHDSRPTWACCHRRAETSCDELKDLGGWKSRAMGDRYAKLVCNGEFVVRSVSN